MTIDEAIGHEKWMSKDNKVHNFENIVNYHEQLADWSEELKIYRESSYEELHDMIYNKAIDDAINKVSCGGKYNMSLVDELRKLKDGVKNEQILL